ncbi:ABC transporter permease [Cohnella faecalis]|uniref:Transport permease protein n=1 Tax=Cohnella faecalis TaxID=2315694 RepID=A0A398CH60_9BACL|nr:ABC transporter permease [Cohnella faecalis]RIE02083.1 ABC transporter permease [Cohnella faecalis]
MSTLYSMLKETVKNRRLVYELAKKDFRAKYLGASLGIIWAFVQPMIMIAIYWFVFQIGFRSVPVENVPFVLWLMAGIIPWFFISESFSSSIHAITENGYLVKKVVFNVSLLPLVKIVSALFVHLFFIGILFLMFISYGFAPSLYHLQVIYYVFASILFATGFSWLASSIVVFIKDVGQIVAMLLQFGFWLTPIFWSLNIVPDKYRFILKLNPVYYLVEGFRSTFIYHKWFWETPSLTLYFWVVTAMLLAAGAIVFKRLRPHFADVL